MEPKILKNEENSFKSERVSQTVGQYQVAKYISLKGEERWRAQRKIYRNDCWTFFRFH